MTKEEMLKELERLKKDEKEKLDVYDAYLEQSDRDNYMEGRLCAEWYGAVELRKKFERRMKRGK